MLANKYGLQLTIIIAVAVALSLVLLGLFIYDIYQEGLLVSSVPQCQTLPAYQLNTRTPIKHVVIIFLENHSSIISLAYTQQRHLDQFIS
ncbi:hypothetical protein [Vulcanisaeta sp. JCM 16159]|uniref:hypothetical protein n=1 Tax=Vulcanisaeta sp. JCM 16159 TaxID=1295371 RepID=UPI000B2D551E|nr:hypothetical protein [Vulcanisaeta sp. JCM 16159]